MQANNGLKKKSLKPNQNMRKYLKELLASEVQPICREIREKIKIR